MHRFFLVTLVACSQSAVPLRVDMRSAGLEDGLNQFEVHSFCLEKDDPCLTDPARCLEKRVDEQAGALEDGVARALVSACPQAVVAFSLLRPWRNTFVTAWLGLSVTELKFPSTDLDIDLAHAGELLIVNPSEETKLCKIREGERTAAAAFVVAGGESFVPVPAGSFSAECEGGEPFATRIAFAERTTLRLDTPSIRLDVSAPETATIGEQVAVKVRAVTSTGEPFKDFTGTFTLDKLSHEATEEDAGVHTFTVAFAASGPQFLTAEATTLPGIKAVRIDVAP